MAWKSGPFSAGSNPDLSIFRSNLRQFLKNGEVVICDGTYRDTNCLQKDVVDETFSERVRARQESLFSRLKSFPVLNRRIRNDRSKHADCFFAVSNMTQLSIENGNRLFEL